LEKIGDNRSVSPLINTLKDKSEWVRWNAVCTLGQFASSQSLKAVMTVLKNRLEIKLVQDGAAEALAKMYKSGNFDDNNKQAFLGVQLNFFQ